MNHYNSPKFDGVTYFHLRQILCSIQLAGSLDIQTSMWFLSLLLLLHLFTYLQRLLRRDASSACIGRFGQLHHPPLKFWSKA